MKILIGGVTPQTGTVTDVVAAECLDTMLQRQFPGCEVKFWDGKFELASFAGSELFLWAGATDLAASLTPVRALAAAQKSNVPCAVWNAEVSTQWGAELIQASKFKQVILRAIAGIFFGTDGLVKLREKCRSKKFDRQLTRILNQCVWVSVRDAESLAELQRIGVKNAQMGAYSALQLKSGEQNYIAPESGVRYIGVTLSAENFMGKEAELRELFNRLLEEHSTRLVVWPMRPQTDVAWFKTLFDGVTAAPKQLTLVEDKLTPGAIQQLIADCDLVVADTLAMMILALNVDTPALSLADSAALSNFFHNFKSLPPEFGGEFSWVKSFGEIEWFRDPESSEAYRRRAQEFRAELLQRLEQAETALGAGVTA